MEDIAKTAREPILEIKSNSAQTDYEQPIGYKRLFELGYGFGVGDNVVSRIKLNIINGFQINPFFSVGFGTGLRYWNTRKTLLIPLFLDLRYNLLDKNVSPYVALGTGYSMNITDRTGGISGSFMLNPTVGATVRRSSKSSMNIGLGYDLLSLRDPIYHAISFNLGLSF
ncbi:MAG: hypothetical protein RIA69_20945 [Cyclobacteriaceae bacterium]